MTITEEQINLIKENFYKGSYKQKWDKLFLDRNVAILKLRLKGYSLEYIGIKYDLTRERIKQIIDKWKRIIKKNIEYEIKWDTGLSRNCFHQNPHGYPEKNTENKMNHIAKLERRYDIQWGVVNPGNAHCHSIHRTKKEANQRRKSEATAYRVVKVIITPIYTSTSDWKKGE